MKITDKEMNVEKIYTKAGFVIFLLANTVILFMIFFYITLWLKGNALFLPDIHPPYILLNTIIIISLYQFIFHLFNIYNTQIKPYPMSLTVGISISILITMILGVLSYHLLPFLKQDRDILTLASALALFFTGSWWFLYRWTFNKLKTGQRILILGSSEIGRDIMQELLSKPRLGYQLIGVIEEFPTESYYAYGLRDRRMESNKTFPFPIMGSLNEFEEIVQDLLVDRIVVALAERRTNFPLETLLECKLRGVKIQEATDFYEQLTGKIVVQGLRPSWLIFSHGFRKSKLTQVMKRVLDVIISALMLLLASPLMAITAILIKLESRGPVIFKQERVGEGGKLFDIYKFRSMTTDAEAKTGPVWAIDRDPRVTQVGRFIRKFRIDELPQLINILKGDMSFVGPRPERLYFVEILKKEIPYYGVRLTVKPGLTGWAQVSYSYGSSKEDALEKLHYDLFYIKNLSLWLDVKVIFKTVRVVLSGKGAK